MVGTLDVDAFCNYSLLIVVGFILAAGATLAPIPRDLRPHMWLVPGAWLVFAINWVAPAATLAVLDNYNVVRDTSLIATVIIALTYRQILSGEDPQRQAPAGLTGLWRRFASFSERVSSAAVESVSRRRKRLFDRTIDAASKKPEVYQGLLNFVRSNAASLSQIDEEVQKIEKEAAGAAPPLSPEATRERVARMLLARASVVEDFELKLKRARVLPASEYFMYVRGGASRLVFAGVCAIVVGIALLLIWRLPVDWRERYSVHRISKPDITEVDRWRAERRLRAAMAGKDAANVMTAIAARLQQPGLDVGRADVLLGMFEEAGATDPARRHNSASTLIPALRCSVPDMQVRVQRTLVNLAKLASIPENSCPRWDPLQQTSVTDSEAAVRLWTALWSTYAPPAPTPARPAT